MPRPHKPILSRDLIVATALELTDRTGRFTVPELAQRLGVSVSSLYHHVAGRADIVEGIRGLMAAALSLPAELGWQEAVVHWASAYRNAFAAHPSAIPMLMSQTVSDPETLAHYDELAEVLHTEAGLDGEELMVAITMLDNLCVGAALEIGAPSDVWLSSDRDTALSRAAAEATHGVTSQTAFDRQLRLVVADLARRAESRAQTR